MSRAKKQKTEEPSTQLIRPSAVSDFQDKDEIQSNWECPVCLEILLPPIYLCTAGHSVCCGCTKQLKNKCPLCKAKLGNARNFVLEKMFEVTRFNCRYQVDGCEQNVSGSHFQSHMDTCRYKPVECPFALDEGCSGLIPVSKYYDHIKNTHLPVQQCPAGGQHQQGKHTAHFQHNAYQLNGHKKSWTFDNQLFISEMIVDVLKQRFQYRLHILGNPDQAKKYKAELFVMKPGSGGCAPNILKGVFPIPVKSIKERSADLINSWTSFVRLSGNSTDLTLNFQDFTSPPDENGCTQNAYQWAEQLFLKRVQDNQSP